MWDGGRGGWWWSGREGGRVRKVGLVTCWGSVWFEMGWDGMNEVERSSLMVGGWGWWRLRLVGRKSEKREEGEFMCFEGVRVCKESDGMGH